MFICSKIFGSATLDKFGVFLGENKNSFSPKTKREK